jgi:microcystin-dependent protein
MPTPFLGEIRLTAWNIPPKGWARCNGATIKIADNPDLFKLINTTYGGDGITVFKLPDLQGRVPVHKNDNNIPLGYYGGEETVTLQLPELPVHTHTVNATVVGNSENPADNFWGSSAVKMYADPPGTLTMNFNSITLVGSGQPHDNMIPYVTIGYIIATEGIYPQ